MIYPGTDLKFRIKSSVYGFSLTEHDFTVEIVGRRGYVRQRITKEQMFSDADGAWYFTLDNVRSGKTFAKFYASIPDGDFDKLTRTVTDIQLLCVAGCCCGQNRGGDCCAHIVKYEQVWTADLDDGTYLAGSDGSLILTADGCRIKVA